MALSLKKEDKTGYKASIKNCFAGDKFNQKMHMKGTKLIDLSSSCTPRNSIWAKYVKFVGETKNLTHLQ